MLKIISTTVTLCITSISLLPEISLASPLPQMYNYPIVPSSTVDTLVCYAQIDDENVLDLSQLCKDGEVEERLVGQGENTSDGYATSNSNFGSTYPDSSYAPITYSGSGYASSK